MNGYLKSVTTNVVTHIAKKTWVNLSGEIGRVGSQYILPGNFSQKLFIGWTLHQQMKNEKMVSKNVFIFRKIVSIRAGIFFYIFYLSAFLMCIRVIFSQKGAKISRKTHQNWSKVISKWYDLFSEIETANIFIYLFFCTILI